VLSFKCLAQLTWCNMELTNFHLSCLLYFEREHYFLIINYIFNVTKLSLEEKWFIQASRRNSSKLPISLLSEWGPWPKWRGLEAGLLAPASLVKCYAWPVPQLHPSVPFLPPAQPATAGGQMSVRMLSFSLQC